MMLNTINNKKIPLKTVLMDSWYATQRLMGLIDNDRKIYSWKRNSSCNNGEKKIGCNRACSKKKIL